ncbi:glycosyltransferase family 4 protein [Erythrobacter litoralis]|uniref:glycosyltransferase n=1 Tax=Erythrobacter litoralis TaxID=39960 RepID=UPI00243607A1|nr:glycosyltransferase [Erythrobacter litoralis]MDG6079708.1 glycosyltransferase family 4 protein [Erythrobacter litoralis]
MKIAVVAHIRYAIAEPFSGGMEAHTKALCEGLRAAGHHVTLFAAAKSNDTDLVPLCDPYDDVLPWEIWRGTERLADFQERAFAAVLPYVRLHGYDAVHNNSLFPQLIEWCAEEGVPCVTTQHVPPFENMVDAVRFVADRPEAVVTVPSHDQAVMWDRRGCPNLTVVPNGIDTTFWCPNTKRGDYFTWAGRIVANKGTAEAVRAAQLGGFPLRLFGPIEDRSYFAAEVEPYLGGSIEYCGHLTGARLRDQIAGGRGALVTPMWDEPFGLVAAEALACGVPVAAFDRGALHEVVGDCGILVPPGDATELARAVLALGAIDVARCRARATADLSIPAMIERYEDCYEVAISGARSAAAASSCARTTALLANG